MNTDCVTWSMQKDNQLELYPIIVSNLSSFLLITKRIMLRYVVTGCTNYQGTTFFSDMSTDCAGSDCLVRDWSLITGKGAAKRERGSM